MRKDGTICSGFGVACLGVALAGVGFPSYAAQKSHAGENPNFVFVLLDDLAFDAIENSGRYPFLETPNINRLQREGVTFSNFFCTMSLSSPSRASLLTGVYPHMHGVNQNNTKIDPMWDKYPPYPELLQRAGYETAFVGKMHNAELDGEKQVRPGFDYWFGFKGQGTYFNPKVNENGHDYVAEGQYMTDLLTDKVITWLEEQHDPDKNFSLCLWHKAVHAPHLASPEDEGKYENEELPLPPAGNGVDRYEGKPAWLKYKKSFDRIWENDPEWNPHFKAPLDILETLLSVDRSLGRVLDALERMDVLDNTVVIFSSDNGYLMGEHGFWDKRIAYEESIRVPMIVRYPKMIKAGTVNNDICLNIDVAPTILDLAGVDIPEYMQGCSMKPLFEKNGNRDWRKSFMYEYFVDDAYPYAGPNMLAIRTDSYKLIDSDLEDDIDELYDLRSDPGEMVNLISDPEYDAVETELRRQLDSLKQVYDYNPDRDFYLRRVLAGEKHADKDSVYSFRRTEYASGENNWMNIYLPSDVSAGPFPVVLWAHPNSDGKVLPSADDIPLPLVRNLASAGIAVVSWESVPQVKTDMDVEICGKDLERVYRWLGRNAEKYGLDMNNVFLSGASRGTVVSWKFINEFPEKIRGAYLVQALPKGAWDNPSHTPLDYISSVSPVIFLGYREGMDTSDGHSPKYGQRIADKYKECGIGDRVTLECMMGRNLYSKIVGFINENKKQ